MMLGMTNTDDDLALAQHQAAVMALLDDLDRHDRDGLAALTVEQRQAQLLARQELYRFVDRIWEDAKARGLNPAMRPEWSSWAALRDLTGALVAHAEQHD